MKKLLMLCVVLGAFTLGGCASNNAQQQVEYNDPKDPFEPVNRAMWDLNYEVLDAYIVRPITVYI